MIDFCRNGYRQHTVNNLQMSKHPIGMELNKATGEGVSLSSKSKVKRYAKYQENFLTVQSLRQVFLSRLRTKEDSTGQPCLLREDAPYSLDFTLQKAYKFNV